jgi:hypothetical protein
MCWRGQTATLQPDLPLRRFQAVLLAALQTEHYAAFLQSAGLGTPEAVEALKSIEDTLPRLPRMDLDELRRDPARFHSPGARPPRLHKLHYPLDPAPKTAILLPGFAENGKTKVLAKNWQSRVERFRPEAIAAPLGVLRELARHVEHGSAVMAHLQYPIIAFTTVGEGPLSDADRELFWQAFEVPVFEQFLGHENELIAWECEAHDGLHIVCENAILECDTELLVTSLTGRRKPVIRVAANRRVWIERSACGCGRTGSRLIAGHGPVSDSEDYAQT